MLRSQCDWQSWHHGRCHLLMPVSLRSWSPTVQGQWLVKIPQVASSMMNPAGSFARPSEARVCCSCWRRRVGCRQTLGLSVQAASSFALGLITRPGRRFIAGQLACINCFGDTACLWWCLQTMSYGSGNRVQLDTERAAWFRHRLAPRTSSRSSLSTCFWRPLRCAWV